MELCEGLVGTGVGRAVPALFPKQGASPSSEVGPNKNEAPRQGDECERYHEVIMMLCIRGEAKRCTTEV